MSVVDDYMPILRGFNRDLLVDTCRITREAKPGDAEYVAPEDRQMDPDTMQYPEQGRVPVYEGPCRMQLSSTAVGIGYKEYEAGGREVTAMDPELQLPVEGSEDVTVDHVVDYLTCRHDSALEGRVFTIRARHDETHGTIRRLRVSEVVG